MTEVALGAVVLEQVGQNRRGGQIVDGCHLDLGGVAATGLQLEDATESQTTDTTEAVDANLYCH